MAAQTTITNRPAEGGHIIIDAAFFDEDGTAVTPETITWTLYDSSGTIINARDRVSVTPAATVSILVSGLDLAVADSSDLKRFALIEWTFNSSLGTGIPDKNEVRFEINSDLPTVS